jgi:hypothetical protein
MLKKKIWANYQRIVEVFTQQIFNMLSDMGLGSGIWKKPIPDPGYRGQKGTENIFDTFLLLIRSASGSVSQRYLLS